MYFFKTPKLFEFLYPEAVWHGARDNKRVYLTFDDGPIPIVTDYILDLLSDLNIKATFFCVGENVKNNPESFKRIIRDGHCIGNHTYNHLNGWKVEEQLYLENIKLCDDIFKEFGYKDNYKLFRPPYGKIRRKVLKKLKDNHKVIMWDVLSYDFANNVSIEKCLIKSLRYTQNGSIIIFHDSKKTFEKIKFVISQYVKSLMDKNYEFCRIDQIFLRY